MEGHVTILREIQNADVELLITGERCENTERAPPGEPGEPAPPEESM